MAPPTGFALLRGIRPVAGDAATLLAKRLPTRLPKSQMTDNLLAIDPLRVVLAGYGDRAEEALARAKLYQEKEPLQYLTEGRWYDNRAAGLGGQEMPLLTYPGAVIPRTKDPVEGLFRLEPDRPSASIQVAMGSPDPRSVFLEEARHGIDRMLGPGDKVAGSFRAPSAFAELLSETPYDKAEKYMKYYSQPAEVRATLSGLLAESPEFISTRPQAESLLEQALSGGSLREQATAEALLNNQRLRNEYIPYLLKALSAGGLLAGNNLLEEQ
jgi:hypothetical protein